jgi:hypothetical protein
MIFFLPVRGKTCRKIKTLPRKTRQHFFGVLCGGVAARQWRAGWITM